MKIIVAILCCAVVVPSAHPADSVTEFNPKTQITEFSPRIQGSSPFKGSDAVVDTNLSTWSTVGTIYTNDYYLNYTNGYGRSRYGRSWPTRMTLSDPGYITNITWEIGGKEISAAPLYLDGQLTLIRGKDGPRFKSVDSYENSVLWVPDGAWPMLITLETNVTYDGQYTKYPGSNAPPAWGIETVLIKTNLFIRVVGNGKTNRISLGVIGSESKRLGAPLPVDAAP